MIGIILGIITIIALFIMKKKDVSFSTRVFLGMAVGLGIGYAFPTTMQYFGIIGDGYVSLIKMLVIPLVVSVIISSITSMEDRYKLKTIGTKSLALLLLTTLIASIIGVIVTLLISPYDGLNFVKDASFKAREIPTLPKIIMDMVPSNIVSDMAGNKMIPVIIFTILVAVSITIESEFNNDLMKPVKDFFNGFAKVMFRITSMILELTPYGVFALMMGVASKYGLSAILPLGKVIITIYIACLIQVVVVHGSLIKFVGKTSPIEFFKGIQKALVVAFTTRSSYGTLPVTIRTLTQNLGVDNKIASFVAPMGATMGMNGCGGIYPVMVAIFVAHIFNIDLSLVNYIVLILVTTVASIGTAGVPGTASIMATVVLAAMGLPIEGLAMLMGIDVIIDMARTLTNVSGAATITYIVDKTTKTS